ncbi:MAG: heparinase II/III-family protein [Polyangiaceae bacterium]|nr:heparinase II/III-family protein [Polyangiaceae bacterium]
MTGPSRDGAYLQLSHNYHRLALQVLLLAVAFTERSGSPADPRLLAALERSVVFLHAHQNPADGSLPNFGTNDGGLPALLSTCDFTDFRPTLQAAALASRGERLYPPGPWDEEAAWLLGSDRLNAPLRPRHQGSVSFSWSGFHVLRGPEPSSFACFRCGTVRDRFAQMDMLHVDIFWRGLNVVCDGGSYLYNGPQLWHRHFQGTRAHNTVTVDGLEQMVHLRRFKLLSPTRAATLGCYTTGHTLSVSGEHYAFERELPGCVHRRSLVTDGLELWGVVDDLTGTGRHRLRVHWQLGAFPAEHDGSRATLHTPQGDFSVGCYTTEGTPLPSTLVHGDEALPRGWLSRYYGEKVPAPSFAVELELELPARLVTVLGAGQPRLARDADGMAVLSAQARLAFPDGISFPPRGTPT